MSSKTVNTALDLAILFHDTYERLAPEFGYETRPETRTFSPSSKNGQLMRAVCEELLKVMRSPVETTRKPDGYLIRYGDRVSAYAGSLDSLVFENLKADGIEYTVTPLYAQSYPKTKPIS